MQLRWAIVFSKRREATNMTSLFPLYTSCTVNLLSQRAPMTNHSCYVWHGGRPYWMTTKRLWLNCVAIQTKWIRKWTSVSLISCELGITRRMTRTVRRMIRRLRRTTTTTICWTTCSICGPKICHRPRLPPMLQTQMIVHKKQRPNHGVLGPPHLEPLCEIPEREK